MDDMTRRVEAKDALAAALAALPGLAYRYGSSDTLDQRDANGYSDMLKVELKNHDLAIVSRDPLNAQAARIADLEAALNTPEVVNFARGVLFEAQHQRHRWGADHDRGKQPLDWFWLIGYLAQKAAAAAMAGDMDKAKHHTISTAAALANWHAALSGDDTRMVPGAPLPTEAEGDDRLSGEGKP